MWSECRWSLFVAAGCLVFLGCFERTSQKEYPDVLLITIDTLRADRLHAYGFPQDSTSRIDELASRGTLFEDAIAASSRTVPSHASMMTSRWVRGHSVGSFNGSTRLDEVETLAGRFREAGYDTAAFVSNFVLKRRTGLDRGFETYDDEMAGVETDRVGRFERVARDTAEQAIHWLGLRGRRPLFLWVHLQDPHGPYSPPAPFAGSLRPVTARTEQELPILSRDVGRAGIPRYQAIDGEQRPGFYATRYAEEVAYTDFWVGALVEAFENAGASRERVVLLTADHGESLGENGFFFQHGERSSPDQVWVPLILVGPGVGKARSPIPVSHVDIAPTLLEMAGLAPLKGAEGISLRDLLSSGDSLPERTIYSETAREIRAYRGDLSVEARPGPGAALRNPLDVSGDLLWSGYQRLSDGRWVRTPPSSDLVQETSAHLEQSVPTTAAHDLDDDDRARLRALGYLPDPG